MRAKYRSKLELYMSILENCQDALIHSAIARKSNISHYDTTAHLNFLINLGMMQKLKIEGNNNWKITPYGLECLKKLQDTHQLFTPSND